MPSLPARAHAILDFWTEIGPPGWYAGGEALDTRIRDIFLADWHEAAAGGNRSWLSCAEGILAYLILTDQFPRNMFRGDARSFATDAKARTVAMRAWQHQLDLSVAEPMRQFFYLPLMHSETTFDQDRCVCLMASRMPESGATNLLHARVHREIIRRFGRFPYRNAALGRVTTPEEQTFIDEGGYGALVRAFGG